MNRRSVAVVSCQEFFQADADWPLLHEALRGREVTSTLVAWDDPAADWSAYPLTVVRSPWDYVIRPDDFRSWARHVDAVSSLLNPLAMLEWNLDKRYLADLSEQGVAVVPTQWVSTGDHWSPPPEEFVVKPSISGGGKDTARYQPAQAGQAVEARAHVERLQTAGHTVMVQPYLSRVDAEGELAMSYFGGRFSHAIRKGPLLRRGAGVVERLWESENLAPAVPSAPQRAVAEATVALVTQRFGTAPTYARIDLVTGAAGEPCVLEVELIDPALSLGLARGAAERFAAVIAAAFS